MFSKNPLKKYRRSGLSLLAMLALLAVADPSLAETVAQPCRYVKLATVPLVITKWRGLVSGSINGISSTMFLDSGAQNTVLLYDQIEKFGLALGHSDVLASGISGESVQYRVKLDDLSIGPLHLGKAKLLVIQNSVGKRPFDAIVGADFLFQRDVEISAADKKMNFFHPVGCEDSFLAYWDGNASEIALNEMSPIDHRQVANVDINGKKMRAMIDTGAYTTVLSLAGAARLGITPLSPGVVKGREVGGVGTRSVDTWIASFDQVTIGNETIKSAKITIMDMWGALQAASNTANTVEWIDEQPELLLGMDFLMSHRVLLAPSQRRLYFSYIPGSQFLSDPSTPDAGDGTQK